MVAWARIALGFVALIVVAMDVERATGMGMEAFGPAGEHRRRSSDWQRGVDELIVDPARVYWNWVNGSERAYYDGDLSAVNGLLALYSKIDLAEHPVVIVAGRPSAQSFHGKHTPFVVAFDYPGKLEKGYRQRNPDTALFPLAPQLIIFVDAKLADKMDKVKIPENVELQTSPLRIEAALDRISAKRDAVDPAIVERVGKFVAEHPQRATGGDD